MPRLDWSGNDLCLAIGLARKAAPGALGHRRARELAKERTGGCWSKSAPSSIGRRRNVSSSRAPARLLQTIRLRALAFLEKRGVIESRREPALIDAGSAEHEPGARHSPPPPWPASLLRAGNAVSVPRLRNRGKSGATRTMNPSWQDLHDGLGPAPLEIGPITRTDSVRYQGASGDMNPIHHDDELARSAGFSAPVTVGTFHAGVMHAWLAAWLGPENVRRVSMR
jgi:hypothetical protein